MVSAAFLIVLCAAIYRLDTPSLWSDEAYTGVLGRTAMNRGLPYAFDGRNVLAFADCHAISESLVYTKPPFLPYYLAAASFRLLGVSEFSARIPFACIGACALFPLVAVLRSRTRYAEVVAAIALLSPQSVLFLRNARYYSLIMTGVATVVWLVVNRPLGRKWRAIALSGCFLCLLYSHYFIGLCCIAAVGAYVVFRQRDDVNQTALAAVGATALWLIPHLVMGAGPDETVTNAHLALNQGRWISQTFVAMVMQVVDLDYINSVPLVLVVSCGVVMLCRQSRPAQRDNLMIVLGCVWGVSLLAVAGALGFETNMRYAMLRYFPHAILIGSLMLYFLLRSVLRSEKAALVVFLAVNVCNFTDVSFWLGRHDRPPQPRSWWLPVYDEIMRPPHDAWQEAAQWLQANAQRDSLISVVPSFMNSFFLFYNGARFYFVPPVTPGSPCAEILRAGFGEDAVSHLGAEAILPDWIISFGGAVPPSGYEERFTVGSGRPTPDGARPELTRHHFTGEPPNRQIVIYQRSR
jgi:hypothetical protein